MTAKMSLLPLSLSGFPLHQEVLEKTAANPSDTFLLVAGYPSRGPYSSEKAIFLPTKAAMLLQSLQAARPNHNLIMADFTSLPDVVIAGRQAPLVTSKVTSD